MIIVFVLLIIGASSFIGWQIKNYFIARDKFFKDQILFCELLLAETNFNKTPLKSIIEKNEKQFHKEFLKSLEAFKKCLDEGRSYEEKSILLKNAEKEASNHFFNGLGKTNLQNHNDFINNHKSNLKIKMEKEMENEKKKGSAFFKISICVGIAIAILCV